MGGPPIDCLLTGVFSFFSVFGKMQEKGKRERKNRNSYAPAYDEGAQAKRKYEREAPVPCQPGIR